VNACLLSGVDSNPSMLFVAKKLRSVKRFRLRLTGGSWEAVSHRGHRGHGDLSVSDSRTAQ
jgi:hypothetical protein